MDLRPRRAFAPAVLSAALLLLPAAAAQAHGSKTITVNPTGSTAAIQAAVDAANPGDTIVVRPGVYAGDTVRVNTSRLTIRGSRGAIIDAAGHDFGLTVGPAPNIPADCGTGYSVSDFTIDGLTIRNADDTGIFLMGVNRFRVTGGSYLNNGEYGIFPRCSRDGRIDHNSGGGGDDATIYVGVDKNILVDSNVLTNGELGIELEDTDDTHGARQRPDRQHGRDLRDRAPGPADDLDEPCARSRTTSSRTTTGRTRSRRSATRAAHTRPVARRTSPTTSSSCRPAAGS